MVVRDEGTTRTITPPASPPPDRLLTIDELAATTGVTVRNLRAFRSRGLLPPPVLHGRIGLYGPHHLARVQLVRAMQAEGFNLEAIRRLLSTADGAAADILGFHHALHRPFVDEPAEVMTHEEFVERWRGRVTDADLARAVRMGLLRDLGDGRFEVRSPRLQRAGEELAALGLGLGDALDVVSRVEGHARAIAHVYADLFRSAVWRPFERTGRPPDRWGEVRQALERLRPLAAESLLAVFQRVMGTVVEEIAASEMGETPTCGARPLPR
jgi:DNA-binding transcriptional MerR regulator